jgi:DNA-binding response OmpR family regulator
MRILICEDDFMIVNALKHKLIRENYDVVVATDGRDGRDKITNEPFDLLITDLLMPFMGGLELINYIRNELKNSIPIIVLSTLGSEETVIEAFKLGADDYLRKPFSPNELSIRVRRMILTKKIKV